jgi:hypothetical protein
MNHQQSGANKKNAANRSIFIYRVCEVLRSR